MNRTKLFTVNVAANCLYQVTAFVAGIVMPHALLTAYGSQISGLNSSIVQFLSYIAVVEMGLSYAAVYSLYKPLANGDHAATNAILSAAKRFYTQTGWIFSALAVALALVYPLFKRADGMDYASTALLVLVLGSNSAVDFFTMAKYRVLLTADQKQYVISAAGIVSVTLNAVIVVVMAGCGAPITAMRTVAILPVFARTLILRAYVKKRYRYLDYTVEPDNASMKTRWSAMYMQALGAVQSGSTVALATFFSSLQMISVYTVFHMVVSGIRGILEVFRSGVPAQFGQLLAKGEHERFRKAYGEYMTGYYMLLAFVYAVCASMIQPFVNIYTRNITDFNYNQPVIGLLIVASGLTYAIKSPQSMLIYTAGLYRETRKPVTIQAGIALGGGALLGFAGKLVGGDAWALCGVLTGMILSDIYRTVEIAFFTTRHVTHLPVRDIFLRQLATLAIVAFVYLTTRLLPMAPLRYLHWIFWACAVSLYAGAVTVLAYLALDKAGLSRLLARVRGMLKR